MPYLSTVIGLLKSGVFASDPNRTSSMLFSVPCLGDRCSVNTKSNSSSQGFSGLYIGENCFSTSAMALGGTLGSSFFSEIGDGFLTGSLLSGSDSSGLFVFDRGMLVK